MKRPKRGIRAAMGDTNREAIPDFMQPDVGKGTDNIGVDDIVWTGFNGDIDPAQVVGKEGYDPFKPLEWIVTAIVDGHPSQRGPKRQERIETALKALTGTGRKRGMDERDDYDLLLEVAWRYFVEYVETVTIGKSAKPPELTPIIRKAIEKLPVGDTRRHSDDAAVRRLRRKFRVERHTLLVRVSSESNWDRLDEIRLISAALNLIYRLGIKTELTHVKPRLVPKDTIGSQ